MERKVYSANSQNYNNGSKREKEWENKMSNQSNNINQLYFQNTLTNMNSKPQTNNFQQPNIEYTNNRQPVYYDPNNINQSLNHIVRNDLKSRGMISGNNGTPFHREHAKSEQERKMAILNNIKQQINLTQNNKIQELERKRKEDDKYLYAMENNYPFGRSGAGAPNRDKNGQIMAIRKRLISDPKYQHVNINVDDDYEEVQNQGKNLGLINFKKGGSNSPVKINNNNNAHYDQGYNNQANYNTQMSNYNPPYGNNIMTYQSPVSNSQHTFPNNPMINSTPPQYSNSNTHSMFPQPQSIYPQHNYNPMIQHPFPVNNQVMNSNFPQPLDYPVNNLSNGMTIQNPSPRNIHADNVLDLSVSYKNHELDEEKKKTDKNALGMALRNQMEEKERQKKLEKEMKKEEEKREEERLRKEREQLQREYDLENQKKRKKIEEVKAENHKMMVDGVFVKAKPRERQERKQHEITEKEEKVMEMNNHVEEKVNHDEILRKNVEHEIGKLRNNLLDQQNELLKQINDLKAETQNANLQRYDALKEISQLKEELANQRQDEDLRRKYVYDVLIDNSSKINHVYSSSKMSDYDYFPSQDNKPTKKNYIDKVQFKEEIIKYPNRIPKLPDLAEADDVNLPAESKFIDVDTHFVMDGLHMYEPKDYPNNENKIRQKGIEIMDDHYPIGEIARKKDIKNELQYSNDSYSKKNYGFNQKVEEDLEKNKFLLHEENLTINQIYNKNLDRLKYLSGLEVDLVDNDRKGMKKEENLYRNNNNDMYPTRDGEDSVPYKVQDNFDDFLNKIDSLKLEDKMNYNYQNDDENVF